MKFYKAASAAIAAVSALTITVNAAVVGESVKVGGSRETADQTQKLIDSRPDIQRQMENIDRGVVAVETGSGIFVSWRWLGTESADIKYNLYRNGEKLNSEPMNKTNFTDLSGKSADTYSVSAVEDNKEGEQSKAVSVWSEGYLEIPLQRPTESKMVPNLKDDTEVEANLPYKPSDVSVADLDGDGEYEIVLKWDPLRAPDAASVGYAGDCVIDAYEMDGTLMWRINMGKNIRSGPHDTQFIVYDFDNDGKAEMACRTADGTVAGDGAVIGDASKNWAELNDGKNLQGPLYLTVFNGVDGSVMDTVDFYPQTTGTNEDGTKWDLSMFGDDYGNRSERYLGALGCFDGEHTGFIQSRGYYGRTFMAAYHVENGKIITEWTFDSNEYKKDDEKWSSYDGQGNHSMSTADVDYDGCDEVIFGGMSLDNDGKPLYSTKLGHGDAQHVGDLLPSRPGLEIFSCHESRGAEYGYEMRDARTGEILLGEKTESDNGRACTADIDPNYVGEECWSLSGVLTSADGTVLSTNISMPINYAIYWDGDLGRELQDGTEISKWDYENQELDTIFKAEGCSSINAGKSNPCLTADILGDWREETIYPTKDGNAIRIFTTDIPTSYRIPTLMHDPQYRNHVALQNVCYNQPTHTSYYLGYGTKSIPVPQMFVKNNTEQIRNKDLQKKAWDIGALYSGEIQELVVDCNTALVNGRAESMDTKPYVNEENRTMVPLRFISEAFGAAVDYNDAAKKIIIKNDESEIIMTVGSNSYSANGEVRTMDTVPVISNDRTLVPIRAIAEALNKNIEYYDGLILISDKDIIENNPQERISQIKSVKPSVKKEYDIWSGRSATPNVSASTEEDKAVLVTDEDFTTAWHGKKDDTITVGLEKGGAISAVGFAFMDDKSHKMRIESSGDGEKWEILSDGIVFSGEPGEKMKYIIGITKYHKFVRYTCLDENGCDLSELAIIEVE